MFDFDAGKLLVIGVVALVVIGPKDLPRVLRQLGQAVGKLRRMAGEFQSQFMDAMREAELDEIRQDMAKLSEQTKIQSTFNPLQTVRRELTEAMANKQAATEGAPRLGLEGLQAAAEVSAAPDFSEAGAAPIAQAAVCDLPAPQLHEEAREELDGTAERTNATDEAAAEPQPHAARQTGGT